MPRPRRDAARAILRDVDANATTSDAARDDSKAPSGDAMKTEAVTRDDDDARANDDGSNDGLTAFERAREAHIARNKARMEALNINALSAGVGAASRGSAASSRGITGKRNRDKASAPSGADATVEPGEEDRAGVGERGGSRAARRDGGARERGDVSSERRTHGGADADATER